MSQCKVIKAEEAKFEEKKKGRSNDEENKRPSRDRNKNRSGRDKTRGTRTSRTTKFLHRMNIRRRMMMTHQILRSRPCMIN